MSLPISLITNTDRAKLFPYMGRALYDVTNIVLSSFRPQKQKKYLKQLGLEKVIK